MGDSGLKPLLPSYGTKQMKIYNRSVYFGSLGTASATSGAATLNKVQSGTITSESLSTAAAAEYTLTLTNDLITSNSIVMASAGLGSSTTGTPGIGGVTVSTGKVVITVTNLAASAAFNGTIKIAFFITNPGV